MGIKSPLTQQDLVEEFFMEYRNNLLAIAAFLDRLDRAEEQDAGEDFRLQAFREALSELESDEEGRVKRIQMILSDRDTTLMDERDVQGAYGAYNPGSRVAEEETT